jgi:hypothetical protein
MQPIYIRFEIIFSHLVTFLKSYFVVNTILHQLAQLTRKMPHFLRFSQKSNVEY